MDCRVPLGCQDFLDPLVHGVLGVLLGRMEPQASLVCLDPKDRKETQGSHLERPVMEYRATQACLASQANQGLQDERDTKAILDLQGIPENRGSRDQRAAQGSKVTLAGRGYLDQ